MDVVLEDVRKDYGTVVALDVPSLTVESGSRFGLVGNNGAGKTTFLRLVLDLVKPTRGLVYIGGKAVHRTIDWKARTGSYLDDAFLLKFLIPEEFFTFVGSFYGLSAEHVQTRIARYGSLFTEPVLGGGRFVRELSYGNQKKVGLLAALMVEPELLVLDEPFANLDPTSQLRLKEELNDPRWSSTTMLISSHDLLHVVDVCDRIVILETGRILYDRGTSDTTLQELERYFSGAGRDGKTKTPTAAT